MYPFVNKVTYFQRGKHFMELVHKDPQAYVDTASNKFVQWVSTKVCTESFTVIYIFGT